MKGATKVAEKKQQAVQEFVKLVKEYPIFAVVDMENLPAKQLQKMREQLDGIVLIKMTKKRLMKIIFEKAKADKKDVEKLIPYLKGMPAMIFTKENPFTLYKKLDQNKSSAPAKAGQKATKDIVIPAGPTPFSPGPIIGELGALRIKTGIENGKVAIKETVTVVKEDEEIKPNVASILTRLGIEPMEIGLNLVAVYENGSIFTKDVLAIDETVYLNNIAMAASESFSLAICIGYATADTVIPLVQKAYNDALAIAKSQNIIADETVNVMLATAESGMLRLKAQLNLPDKAEIVKEEATKEEPKGESKEEAKEESKEEPKGESKEEPKEEAKEEPKEESKEEPKEEAKEKPKEEPKGESKEESKEEPKEEAKEKPKEEPKEEPKGESKEEPKEESKEKHNA